MNSIDAGLTKGLKKPPDITQERIAITQERIAKALERIADQLEWDSQRRNI